VVEKFLAWLFYVWVGNCSATVLAWVVVVLPNPGLMPAMWTRNLDISHSLNLSGPFVAFLRGL